MIIDTENSRYFINTKDKTVTGGIFQDKHYPYKKISPVMVGGRAEIELQDGRVVATSTVKKVRSVGDETRKEEYEI